MSKRRKHRKQSSVPGKLEDALPAYKPLRESKSRMGYVAPGGSSRKLQCSWCGNLEPRDRSRRAKTRQRCSLCGGPMNLRSQA